MSTAARMSAALLLLAAGRPGRVSYLNYPPIAKNTASNNPNAPAMEEIMESGLRWVSAKYPPGGSAMSDQPAPAPTQFVVNLPEGVKPIVYRHVAACIPGGEPITPENQHLPT